MGGAAVRDRVGGRSEAAILQEGRYGPRTERERDVRIGALAQGAFDVTAGIVGTGEDGFTIASTLAGKGQPTSATVVGAFAPLCSLFAGMQPLEAGVKLYRSSQGDVWGKRRGVSKVITGLSVVFGAFFKLFARTVSVGGRAGVQMVPELVAFGAVSGTIGTVFSLVLFTSLMCFSLMSVWEGRGVRREVEGVIRESGSSERALEVLKGRLESDGGFARRLERVTKRKVLEEIRAGRVSGAGGVLAHLFQKPEKRFWVNVGMMGLAGFSLALVAVGLVVVGGTPLVVLTALGIVSSVLWFAVDAPGFIKALKSGECGRADKAVLAVTTVLLVGLIGVSAFVATGLVGWIVMGVLGLVCVAVQGVALRRAQGQVGRGDGEVLAAS